MKHGIRSGGAARAVGLLLAVTLAVASAVRGAADAAATAAGNERIAEWIGKLGAPEGEVREAASRALAEIGAPAKRALEAATRHEDPEVRARARDLLANLRYGITTNTPPAMAALLRKYITLSPAERLDALPRLAAGLKADVVPFFLRRTAAGDEEEGRAILAQMAAMKGTSAWRRVIAELRAPTNALQATLLSQACLAAGSLKEMTAAMKSSFLPPQERTAMVSAALVRLRANLADTEMRATAAKEMAEVCPDSRLFYVAAAAARELNQDAEGDRLIAKALELNPEEEAPHYQAATLLEEMELPELAIKEWERILAIPPKDDVYDINAYMRLGRLLSVLEPEKAAEAYEKGLACYRKARRVRGHGMGMLGGTEAEIEKKIRILRGEEDPPEREGEPSPLALDLEVESVLKEGKEADLAAARNKSDGCLVMNVQPEGLRPLEEIQAAEFRYDTKEGAFKLLLNGAPCCAPVPFAAAKQSLFLEVQALDCVYFFDVNTTTGECRKQEKYQYDYRMKFAIGPGFKDWKNVEIRCGGKAYDAAKAAEGIDWDYLPRKMEIQVSGRTPEGKARKLTYTVQFRKASQAKKEVEPKEQPAKENNPAPEKKNPKGRQVIDPRRVV